MRVLLALVLIIIELLCPVSARVNPVLPAMGSSSGNALSHADEKQLAQEFMAELRRTTDLNHDPLIEHDITALGDRLVSAARTSDRQFSFFVVISDAINAFAGPGGNIGINSGLILQAGSESELAAVLAHEIAHVTQNHLARGIEDYDKTMLPTIGALVAAIAIGSQNPEAGLGAAAAVMAGSTQHMINFTRKNEEEADRIGMQTLYRAGFNPSSMPEIFEKMQQLSRYYDSVPAFLSTHPVTESRIADAQNRSARFHARKTLKSSLSYTLMRARLRVLTAKELKTVINFFKAEHGSKRDAANYGLALAYLLNHQGKDAAPLSKQLLALHPSEPAIMLLAAQTALVNQQTEKGFKLFEQAQFSHPKNIAIVMIFAHQLMNHKQALKASALLESYQRQFPNNITNDYLALLFHAQGKAGHIADAYQTKASLYIRRMQYAAALEQLELALKVVKPSADTRATITAKITALKKNYKAELKRERRRPTQHHNKTTDAMET